MNRPAKTESATDEAQPVAETPAPAPTLPTAPSSVLTPVPQSGGSYIFNPTSGHPEPMPADQSPEVTP